MPGCCSCSIRVHLQACTQEYPPRQRANNKKEEQRKVPLSAVTVSTEIADKAAFIKQGCSVGGESMHLWLVIQKLGAILYDSMGPPYVPATP